ncbi:LPXTG cell wall anchor domain-containing protein [Bacillus gaemokensis]|uniref:Gram-positive cocci surface proteins LPxTG domain-containing protein n=1 Tax=Bacillus gaemokensis TaxID=574375 RepID=A0A073KAN7_9BACI|nr:hypothetical protein BAGA_26775 [Bacillus gaemokensis]KYG38325.1 hypothetical protein AZF08_18510 [Bacillus gaemokensis]
MIKITTLALALSLSFFSGLSSGHAAKYEVHTIGNNAVAQYGDDSQGGNGSQDGGSQGGNGSQGGGSKAGNGSNNGKVKGQSTTEQGGKLPNTATQYPTGILVGITTFLLGITLFVRRKQVK